MADLPSSDLPLDSQPPISKRRRGPPRNDWLAERATGRRLSFGHLPLMPSDMVSGQSKLFLSDAQHQLLCFGLHVKKMSAFDKSMADRIMIPDPLSTLYARISLNR